MQNDVANNTVSLNNQRDNSDNSLRGICPGKVQVHRTWFFWGFVLIPVLVVLCWAQYVNLKGPMPWAQASEIRHPGYWNEWMRYYIWVQLVWLPANMVMFLIWCALGVRVWNCKRLSRLQ